jgi:hypothetical protein
MKLPLIGAVVLCVLPFKPVFAQAGVPLPEEKVTFQTAAAPCPKVITALSQAAKVKLATSATHARDVIFVHVRDVPLSELMRRIATVTSSKWEMRNDTYVLVRTSQMERQEEAAELQATVNGLKAWIDKEVKQLDSDGPVQRGTTWSAVATRTLIRLAQGLDLRPMASLKQDEVLVFSTTPNRMQLPLQKTYAQIIDLLTADLNFLRKNLAQRTKSQAQTSLEGQFLDIPSVGEPRPQEAIVRATFRDGVLSLSLSLYNTRGHQTVTASKSFADGSVVSWPAQLTPGNPAPVVTPTVGGTDYPLEYSSTSTEWARVFHAEKVEERSWASQATVNKLIRPETFDPYSFQVSDALSQFAVKKGVGVVANIPDDVRPVEGLWGGTRSNTVNAYVNQLMAEKLLTVSLDSQWLSISPSRPEAARRNRLDRSSFGRLLQACHSTRVAGLAAITAFTNANPNEKFGNVTLPYYLMFCANALQMGDGNSGDPEVHKLIGTLTAGQHREIAESGELDFHSLTSAQRSLIHKMVFGVRADLKVTNLGQDGVAANNPPTPLPVSWRHQATEAMPNGLPNDVLIKVDVTESDCGISAKSIGSAMYGTQGAGGISMGVGLTDPNWKETIELKLGKRTRYRLTFQLAPDIRMEKTCDDDVVDKDAPALTWDRLPKAFSKAIEDQVEARRKAYEERQRRIVPPPPPN